MCYYFSEISFVITINAKTEKLQTQNSHLYQPWHNSYVFGHYHVIMSSYFLFDMYYTFLPSFLKKLFAMESVWMEGSAER